MSAQTLPTRIRQNIRDQITSTSSPLASTFTQLSTTLGYSVIFEPEWGMLWTALHAHYPDPATFVPTVAETVKLWCRAFGTWLEDEEENGEAVERLLEELKVVGSLKLVLEISPTSPRPNTTWRPSTHSFIIALAKSRPSTSQTILAGFSSDLHSLFTQSPSLLAVDAPPPDGNSSGNISRASTSALDDWADLALDSPQTQPSGTTTSRGGAESTTRTTNAARGGRSAAQVEQDFIPGNDPLPSISTLARPEDLLSQPPYHLLIQQRSPTLLNITCTHQGTLTLLSAYLTRWVRTSTDYVTRPPLAEIKLRESVFGLGLLYEGLSVEATGRGREVSALLVRRVVEGGLGYRLVGGGEGGGGRGGYGGGGVWEFRRDRGFV